MSEIKFKHKVFMDDLDSYDYLSNLDSDDEFLEKRFENDAYCCDGKWYNVVTDQPLTDWQRYHRLHQEKYDNIEELEDLGDGSFGTILARMALDMGFMDWLEEEEDRERQLEKEKDIERRTRYVNGRKVIDIDPNTVRNDGSLSCQNLAKCTEPVPIVSIGGYARHSVDELLNQLTQLSSDGYVYNRKWLAGKLSVKPAELNNVLKPSAPARLHNNLANRTVQFMRKQVKFAEKNAARK